jgi:hypothetical protein
LKSLRHNFQYGKTHKSAENFTDSRIIDLFYNSKLTGSHVFSSVKMIMRKVDTLDIVDYDVDWIINEVEHELRTVNTIRNAHYLKDNTLKGEDNSKRIGLVPIVQDDEDEVCDSEESVGWNTKEEINYSDKISDDSYRDSGEDSAPDMPEQN